MQGRAGATRNAKDPEVVIDIKMIPLVTAAIARKMAKEVHQQVHTLAKLHLQAYTHARAHTYDWTHPCRSTQACWCAQE